MFAEMSLIFRAEWAAAAAVEVLRVGMPMVEALGMGFATLLATRVTRVVALGCTGCEDGVSTPEEIGIAVGAVEEKKPVDGEGNEVGKAIFERVSEGSGLAAL